MYFLPFKILDFYLKTENVINVHFLPFKTIDFICYKTILFLLDKFCRTIVWTNGSKMAIMKIKYGRKKVDNTNKMARNFVDNNNRMARKSVFNHRKLRL